MQKIHAYGYERIGFVVHGIFDLKLGGNWLGGFLASQKMLGLAHPLHPFVTQDNVSDSFFRQKFKKWFDKNKPDAILTVDACVILVLEQLNLRIPHDIAVASTSVADIPVSAGIHQNSEEIGRVAAETLITLINFNERGKHHAESSSKGLGSMAVPCRIGTPKPI